MILHCPLNMRSSRFPRSRMSSIGYECNQKVASDRANLYLFFLFYRIRLYRRTFSRDRWNMRGFAVGSRLARKVLSQQREQISFRMPIRQRQRFEIRWESRFGAWPRDLALLFSHGPELSMNAWEFQGRAKSADRKPVRGFLSSAFLHVSAFFLAAQLTFLPAQDVPRETVASDSTDRKSVV